MKSDTDFLNDFTRGLNDANRFFRRLRENGVDTFLMPYTYRPDKSERKQHSDDGDGALLIRVEYKKRDIHFTNRDDYPYKTVIVDEVYNYAQKTTPWLFYVIENAAGTHVALVYWFTDKYWKIESYPDKRQGGRLCHFYTCPKDKVPIMPIERLFVARPPAMQEEAAA